MPRDIRRLTARQRITGFSSGEAVLDRYLVQDALAHAQVGYTRTWVMLDQRDRTVLGYVALSAASQPVKISARRRAVRVLRGTLDRCPYPEVPVLEIGYIATRKDMQGKGIATELLSASTENCR